MISNLRVVYGSNCIFIPGMIPSSLCQLTKLTRLNVTGGGSNVGLTCTPGCLSFISSSNLIVPSQLCPSNQDIGVCGLISATNIQSVYSQWSCTTLGVTSTAPCSSPVWPGLGCSGTNIASIILNGFGIAGIEVG